MSYDCKIVADSIAHNGARLTTFEITYPLIIHAEIMTHRVFSRNVASNRAIPVDKLISSVESNPFIPDRFPANQSGMQNSTWLEKEDYNLAVRKWLDARDSAVEHAVSLKDLGVHKQIANRLLAPFLWTTAVISSTEWNNFFTLRVDVELAESVNDFKEYDVINDAKEFPFPAQREIQKIAFMMLKAYRKSEPKMLEIGEWHLPYVTKKEVEQFGEDARLLSAGRCGKVSYLTHGESNTPEKDISIARDKMVGNKHWSPVEHPATPTDGYDFCGNFRGWKQLRKFYAGESGEFPVGMLCEQREVT